MKRGPKRRGPAHPWKPQRTILYNGTGKPVEPHSGKPRDGEAMVGLPGHVRRWLKKHGVSHDTE